MSPDPPAVRIVVADDHDVVRSGFASLLDTQSEFTVIGTARDGLDAIRIVNELHPDVVLMDIRMPGTDGIEATRRLTSQPEGPRVLILTTFDLDQYVYDALRAGASGFLLKDVTAEQLFDAVRVIAAGDALLAPSVTRRLIADFSVQQRASRPSRESIEVLTPRENEILRLIARGLSNAEISENLFIAEQTTKTHVGRILSKLGLRDRAQAVVLAYETGLVSPGL